jgi:hypothetical protein
VIMSNGAFDSIYSKIVKGFTALRHKSS